MNKIYFIGASTIWPVGDPGAIVGLTGQEYEFDEYKMQLKQ